MTTCEQPCAISRPRVLSIPDADGETHDYLMAWAAEGLDAWACTLTRLDGDGTPYRIACTLAGSWACSCPAARYRARKRELFCKHVSAIAPVYLTMKEWIDHATEEARQ